MQTHTHAHRHLFVAPAFALLLLLSLSGSRNLLGAMLSPSHEGIRVIAAEGSLIDAPIAVVQETRDGYLILSQGSVLALGEGKVTLKTPDATVTGLGGGYFVARNSQTLTVAALTTPVLIRTTHAALLVPIGTQWRGNPAELVLRSAGINEWAAARVVQEFPADFMKDKWTRLEALSGYAADVALLPKKATSAPAPLALDDVIRMKAARIRAQSKFELRFLGYVRMLLEGGRSADALAQLQSAEGKAVLKSKAAQMYGPALLKRFTSDTGVAMALLQGLQSSADIALVASMHPRTRTFAWTLMPPTLSEEDHLLRIATFPQSDLLPEAAADLAVTKWMEEVMAFMPKANEELRTYLSTLWTNVVLRARALDYPERTARYNATLKVVFGKSVNIAKLAEPSALHGAAPAKQEGPSLSNEEILMRVKNLLRQKGVLFTIESKIEPMAPASARISQIVIPSSSGDRMFSLELNVVTLQVKNVVLAGQRLPHAVTLDAFSEWARNDASEGD